MEGIIKMEATSPVHPTPSCSHDHNPKYRKGLVAGTPIEDNRGNTFFSSQTTVKKCSNYCYRPVFLVSLKINTNMYRKGGSRKSSVKGLCTSTSKTHISIVELNLLSVKLAEASSYFYRITKH